MIVYSFQSKPGVNWDGLSAYYFTSTRFYSDLSENSSTSEMDQLMYYMSHTYRTDFLDYGEKCIEVSDVAVGTFNHGNTGCVNPGRCFKYNVETVDGYIHHYRNGWKVTDECKDGKCVINDTILLKYKTKLELQMKYVLAKVFQ